MLKEMSISMETGKIHI